MPRITASLRRRVKMVLARRFVEREELAQVSAEMHDLREQMESRILQFDLLLTQFGEKIDVLSEELHQVAELTDVSSSGLSTWETFLSHNQPLDMRKRVFEADRLARESALAIELLLQAGVLMRRDMVALAEAARPGEDE